MEDATLFSANELDPEYAAYQAILPYFMETIEDNYAPPEDLNFQKLVSCGSVYYGKTLLFRICIRKKSSYISFSTNNPKLFSGMDLYQMKSDAAAGFYRCNLTDSNDIINYSEYLCRILDKAINSQSKECDICDLYDKCSNAKKCVHPKREFALHCGYRRMLRSGRIFYGANRNVD